VALVLIRMKVLALRHSMTGTRATWMTTGAFAGLVLAAGMLFLATRNSPHPSAVGDVLALSFALIALGWLLGPLLTGESQLRPDHFRLLPIPSRRLAFGLLAAAMVGVGAAVTLLSFLSLIVYAGRLGMSPTLVAIPAWLLQLVLVVVLARLGSAVFGKLTGSRLGGFIAGLTTAAMLFVTQSGWVVIERTERVLATGLPSELSTLVRLLPSGWGIVAVDAAARSDWLVVAGALLGIAIGVAVLLGVWGRMLSSPRAIRATIRGSSGARLELARDWGRTGSAAIKELRTWVRDPSRMDLAVVAPAFALMTSVIPFIYDTPAALPWAGPVTALLASATAANLYGQDGTALWLTLLTPGAARRDVRARQLGWAVIVGPISLTITVAFTVLSGLSWAWPWALAMVASFLGGGAGLLVLVGVTQLAVSPDPLRRTSSLDHGDTTGQSIVMIFAGLLAAAPVLGVLVAGAATENEFLEWAGVAVGIGWGAFLAWALGGLAGRRLEERGPELLQVMRSGREQPVATAAAPSVIDAMSGREKTLMFTSVWLGSIALFPQALVPLVIKLSGGDERVWFLPLYLPQTWQWPAIVGMAVAGLLLYGLAIRIYRRRRESITTG
jgi:hypothetical protein